MSSCDDKLEVLQQYDFTIEILPIPDVISQGETIEIRCNLKEKGNFADNVYTIRYFQFSGEGSLKLGMEGLPFVPNDKYVLTEKEFRLYYTSNCEESQSLTVYENSFRDTKTLAFDFNNKSNKEE